MKHLRLTCLSLLTLLLVPACETVGERFSKDSAQLVAQPDSVSAMLADAADRASNALETLAAVEQSRTPDIDVSAVNGAPAELRRAITMNWVGPVEPVVKALADRASYNFATIGPKPPSAVVVRVDVQNMPVVEVLRDIGLQLGTRANIRIDGPRKVVEVNYIPNEGVGR